LIATIRPARRSSSVVAIGSPGQRLVARIDERERRPAGGAGVRLGVEAPGRRIGVFTQAEGALRERRHAGLGTVVGELAGQREARAALGAVDEGVAMAPVGRIEQLAQARVAGRAVGRYRGRDLAAPAL
jgi:hypothetical protein